MNKYIIDFTTNNYGEPPVVVTKAFNPLDPTIAPSPEAIENFNVDIDDTNLTKKDAKEYKETQLQNNFLLYSGVVIILILIFLKRK